MKRTYKVPYLIHPVSLTVITVQHKAWMDTVRLAMWFDLQLGPYYEAKKGKCALVWDNCGPHNVEAIKDIAAEWRIFPMNLPANMTDVLQVMDLVVNAPVKAAIRRDRANELFTYAQAFKIEWLKATHAQQAWQSKPAAVWLCS